MPITHRPQDGSFVRRQTSEASPASVGGTAEELRNPDVAIPAPSFDANDKQDLSAPFSPANVILNHDILVCRVETILSDRFTAIFSVPGVPDQRVRFMLRRVAHSDRHLLCEGAVFYWIRGIERDENGDLKSASFIRFRRTPRPSPRQIEQLDKLAEEAIRAGGGVPIDEEELQRRLSESEENIPPGSRPAR
jgi:hypothetical protein